MKISKLTATFECHKETEIELADGLTVICGVNDSGKSSLNRALRWVTTNTPKGDSYLPWWDKSAGVTVQVGEEAITRFRNKTQNGYRVGGKEMKALGNSVPDEVTTLTKLTDLNIQKQVDQFYILNSSPGDVAKLINGVAGISESDDAIKLISQVIRDTKKDIKATEEYLTKERAIVKDLDWVEDAKALMFEAETISGLADSAGRKAADLKEKQNTIKDIQVILDTIPDLNTVEEEMVKLASVEAAKKKIEEMKGELSSIKREIEAVDIKKYEDVDSAGVKVNDLAELVADLEKKSQYKRELRLTQQNLMKQDDWSWFDQETMDKAMADIATLETSMSQLVFKDAALEAARKEITSHREKLINLDAAIQAVEAELAKIKVCPECGQEIGGDDATSHSSC